MAGPDLDRWLPDPAIQTCYRRSARAEPAVLWDAAQQLRLCDTRTLGRVVRWRIPGLAADETFRDLFSSHPFTVLDEGERCSVSGLVGRIWTMERDYPRLSGAEEFRAWDRPGTARVLFAHWVEEDPQGGVLVSATRVRAVDRRSALRVRALWTVVGGFERLIGGEALRAAVRRAERF